MKQFLLYSFMFLSIGYSYAQAQKKPNIVIIISDDHAVQAIGAYNKKGVGIQTPNIDQLAKEGMIFHRAYVTNSICGPSRASILTGKYSNKNGYTDNETSFYNSNQQQFSNLLQNAGYQTAWIGKYHLGRDPKGFDFFKILIGQGYYFNPDFIIAGNKVVREQGYVSDIIENEAEKWLDNRDKDKPFCLVIGHKATHRTWMPALEDLGTTENIQFPIPASFYDTYVNRKPASMQQMSISKDLQMGYDLKMFEEDQEDKDGNFKRMTPEQRKAYANFYHPIKAQLDKDKLSGKALAEWKYQRYMRDYMATVKSLDRNIGRTMQYLEKNNLKENTLVIYLSDQGFYMGEHGWFDKRWMYEESFRTPMVVRFPKMIKPQQSTHSFVMNMDIAPTLLELAGTPIPNDIQGKSLVSIFKKSNASIRKNVFYHYYENGEHAVSPHFGIKTPRYKLIRFYKRHNGWELYDLKKDPSELNNVYNNPAYKHTIKKLKKQLLKEINQYEDELALKIWHNQAYPVQ